MPFLQRYGASGSLVLETFVVGKSGYCGRTENTDVLGELHLELL